MTMREKLEQIRKLLAQSKIDDAFLFMEKQLAEFLSLRQENIIVNNKAAFHGLKERIGNGIISDTDAQVEKAKIITNILELIDKILQDENSALAMSKLGLECLIQDGSFSFLRRDDFRKKVISHIKKISTNALFVKGEEKSGMSYLQNFLYHFSRLNSDSNINIISINMERLLNNPATNKSSSIIEIMLEKIGKDSTTQAEEHIKFIRLGTALKDYAQNRSMFPVFFFHDFHKVHVIADEIYQLIYQLIEQSYNCLFIFAGLNYDAIPNWIQVRNGCEFYSINNSEISRKNVEECFQLIFKKYRDKIITSLSGQQITFEDYYSQVYPRLFVTPDDGVSVNISQVGTVINNHLYHIKQL